jgi:hypothetical protein
MPTLAEACGSAVAFTYRSIDRLILNAYIPTLQMPGAMVTFLREVQGKPILSPVVFKALTDRFVAAVQAFTEARRIPTLDSFDTALRPALLASSHSFDHALADLNAGFDQLAELSGLKLAA